MSRFDEYATDYREVINRVSKLSGEEYEFFIELRVGMMASRLQRRDPGRQWGTILDFGCGSGATELALRKAFPGSAIHGIDESAESIRVARARRLAGVEFVCRTEARLPYPDETFDLIYLNGVIHHVPEADRPSVMGELRRVLKRGGDLFVYENNPANPLMMRAMAKNPFDAGLTAVSPGSVRGLAGSSGLSVAQSWYYFFFPRALSFLRWAEPGLGWLPAGAQYGVWIVK